MRVTSFNMRYLRGAVAKLGQLMTCFGDALPAGFADVLGNLHFQAPPMHYEPVRASTESRNAGTLIPAQESCERPPAHSRRNGRLTLHFTHLTDSFGYYTNVY